MKHFLLLLLLAALNYGQSYSDDSLVVRSILDLNGWNNWTVEQVTESNGSRITSLNLNLGSVALEN